MAHKKYQYMEKKKVYKIVTDFGKYYVNEIVFSRHWAHIYYGHSIDNVTDEMMRLYTGSGRYVHCVEKYGSEVLRDEILKYWRDGNNEMVSLLLYQLFRNMEKSGAIV